MVSSRWSARPQTAANVYEVLKPLDVEAGLVAPAFGQPGLGIQYQTSMPVADLLREGFLKEVGP